MKEPHPDRTRLTGLPIKQKMPSGQGGILLFIELNLLSVTASGLRPVPGKPFQKLQFKYRIVDRSINFNLLKGHPAKL